MIPFEDEASLTPSEEYAQEVLDANWDHVVRTTPGVLEDVGEKFPRISEIISRRMRNDAGEDLSNVFRPGVPDFMAFNQKGDYLFVEVKSGDDGLRHTQLKWFKGFKGVNAEIWFTGEKEVEEKLDGESIDAYSFQEKKGESSENLVAEERDSKYLLELPKTLGSIIGISKGESVKWRLKSKDELILDSK